LHNQKRERAAANRVRRLVEVRSRANSAHIRESKTVLGFGFQVQVLNSFHVVATSLVIGRGRRCVQ
jgi:hypothetical protein